MKKLLNRYILEDDMRVKNLLPLAFIYLISVEFFFLKDFLDMTTVEKPPVVLCLAVLSISLVYLVLTIVRQSDILGATHNLLFKLAAVLSFSTLTILLIYNADDLSSEYASLAKKTLLHVIMLTCNLTWGLCILSGKMLYNWHSTPKRGRISYLVFAITITGISFNLLIQPGQVYSNLPLLLLIGLLMQVVAYFTYLLLKASLLAQQTAATESTKATLENIPREPEKSDDGKAGIVVTVLLLIPTAYLTKNTLFIADRMFTTSQLPADLASILIAIVLIAWHSTKAYNLALNNELGRSFATLFTPLLNILAVALPLYYIISPSAGRSIVLSFTPSEMMLCVATMFLATITYITKKITWITGIMHVALFILYAITTIL